MLMFVQEMISELKRLRDYAESIRQKFEQGREPEELLLDAESLDIRLRAALKTLPNPDCSGGTERHLYWLIKNLRQNNTRGCRSDIDDLAENDISNMIAAVEKWAIDMDFLDAELKEGVVGLIMNRQFDSAIRKCFVILTERLRTVYSLQRGKDGEELVNLVFGKTSSFHLTLDDSNRQAYRNYMSGLYGVIRNKFSHGDHEPTIAELETALASSNYCLQIIEELKSVK